MTWGDPNREFGTPGIDDQVPGSAAQAAGIAAAERGEDPVAAAVAAGGTSTDFSDPRSVWDAWLRGGAQDYNYNVFKGIPGYQSSNPSIFYGMSEAEQAPFGSSYWAGSTLSPEQQREVERARRLYASTGSGATNAQRAGFAQQSQGASSMAPTINPQNAGATGAPAGSGDWWEDWMVNYDPNDPESMASGWRNTLQGQGINPYGNNPYQRWLQDDNLMQPLIQRWLVSKYLGGGFSQTDPTDMYSQARGFLQGGRQPLMGGTDMLAALKNQVGQYLTPGPDSVAGLASNPGLAPLVAALTTSDNFAKRLFTSILGAGSGGAMMSPIAAYVNMLARMYQDSAGAGGANNFAQWMLGRL
jgi:hypothetical protein